MRTLSQPAYISLISRVTTEIWLALLTINIDGVFYRVVANSHTPVISNGQQFDPYPFDVLLPDDSMEGMMSVQITIDNVDLVFVNALRAAVRPLIFEIRFVLASQPDVIEVELTDLESQLISFDAQKITAQLLVNDIWNAKFPSIGGTYDPAQCPGLF